MKVPALENSYVTFKLINRYNLNKKLDNLDIDKPKTILDLMCIINAADGVIYKTGDYAHTTDLFPSRELFGCERLFMFAYHTSSYGDSGLYFVVAETMNIARQLFIDHHSCLVIESIVDCEFEVVLSYNDNQPYLKVSDIAYSKYVNFELLGGDESMMGEPLPCGFIAETVSVKWIAHYISKFGFVDTNGKLHTCMVNILDLINDDEYKNQNVYLVHFDIKMVGWGYVLCLFSDDIEATITKLNNRGASVNRYWKINMVDD